MTTSIAPLITGATSGEDQVFPTLTTEQMQRIAAHGHMRRVEAGEVLVKVGAPITHFYVVRSGSLDGLQPMENGDDVSDHHPWPVYGRGFDAFRAAVAGDAPRP